MSRRNLTPNSRLQNGSIPTINNADKCQRHKHKNKQKVKNDCKTQTVEEKCERSEKDIQTAYTRPDIDAETKTGSTAPEAARNMADMFPRDTHWFVSLFTLVFRVWYVSRMKNWWILHPDEIYQTLEGNYFFFLDSNACCMCWHLREPVWKLLSDFSTLIYAELSSIVFMCHKVALMNFWNVKLFSFPLYSKCLLNDLNNQIDRYL